MVLVNDLTSVPPGEWVIDYSPSCSIDTSRSPGEFIEFYKSSVLFAISDLGPSRACERTWLELEVRFENEMNTEGRARARR